MATKKITYAMAEKMETPKHKKMEIAMAKKALAKKPMHLMPNGKMMPGKKHKKK